MDPSLATQYRFSLFSSGYTPDTTHECDSQQIRTKTRTAWERFVIPVQVLDNPITISGRFTPACQAVHTAKGDTDPQVKCTEELESERNQVDFERKNIRVRTPWYTIA